MTVGALQAISRPSSSMDFLQQSDTMGFNQMNTDHSLTDQTSIYAYSPSSLYLCDLEKSDMQSSFENMNNQSPQFIFGNEEFDLPDTYEMPQEILPTFNDNCVVPDNTMNNSTKDSKNFSFDEGNCKDIYTMLQNSSTDFLQEPTLAAINSQVKLEEYISPKNSSPDKTPVKGSLTTLTNWSKVGTEPSQLVPTQRIVPEPKSNGMKSNILSQMLSGSLNSLQGFGNQQITQTVTSESECNQSEMQMSFEEKKPSSALLATLTQPDFYKMLPSQGPSSGPTNVNGTIRSSSLQGKRKGQPIDFQEEEPENIKKMWAEVRQFIDEAQPPMPKVKRENRGSVGSTKTLGDDSDDYLSTDEDDGDNSDYDSDDSQEGSWGKSGGKSSNRKKETQYFWQYNIQSKGPKGTRMNFDLESNNPHVLKSFQDPVFDSETVKNVVSGNIRHGGKARKGDGNDVRPNPKKLFQIGEQLKRLNKQINQFGPLGDMPVSNKNKSKKEKNKLASRACRLKKKAQHEAYKVKLYGLELEHKQLMTVLSDVKAQLRTAVKEIDEQKMPKSGKTINILEDIVKKNLTVMVAGNTTDYVNSVIKKVEDGDNTGGMGT